ncbi:hypothetical protein [Bradyrhizobium sp. S3.14.4]
MVGESGSGKSVTAYTVMGASTMRRRRSPKATSRWAASIFWRRARKRCANCADARWR